jgi:chitin disaccharide deacetylase
MSVRGPVVMLIVNADDYGITQGTNRRIERAHTEGVVTSTSAMVNQVASSDVAGLRQRQPELGIGIHLTLTLGRCVCDPGRVRSLVNSDGALVERAELLARIGHGELAPEDVARECAAQIGLLREFGVEPDHWNMHQHLQEYAPIGAAAASAMAGCGLRVARNPHRLETAPRSSPQRILRALQARRRRKGARAVTAVNRTPDALLDTHPGRWGLLLPSLSEGVFEAVCHPSEPDAQLSLLTPGLVSERVAELETLIGPRLRCALRERGVQLATFASIFGD